MTPLYIDDPHGFKLSDESLVQILLRAGECLVCTWSWTFGLNSSKKNLVHMHQDSINKW